MVTTTSSISPVLPVEPSSVASIFPPVIQIYSFCPDPRNRIIPVQPLIADPFDDTTFRPVLVAQLNLPTIVPGQVVGSFDIRPDPAFPPLPRGALHTLGERKPFTQDPSKGVVVFELAVGDPPGLALDMGSGLDGQTFEMFVLRETFVDMANEGEERLRRSRLPEGDADRLEVWDVTRTLRWDEWGVEHSRLMETSMPRRHWVSSLYSRRISFGHNARADLRYVPARATASPLSCPKIAGTPLVSTSSKLSTAIHHHPDYTIFKYTISRPMPSVVHDRAPLPKLTKVFRSK